MCVAKNTKSNEKNRQQKTSFSEKMVNWKEIMDYILL